MISLPLSNFIKTVLNIQDYNISFPEEDYYQIIKKDDYLIKIFKGFLKSNYCSCPHCNCNSNNIVKNAFREHKIKFVPFQNFNISIATVQRIVNDYYPNFKVNKEHLPETICIDEFNSVKNIDGAMSFVFAYYQTKNITDIVEDRRFHSLMEYFSRFSLEARNNVKYICMDVYSPYISLVKSIFPKAKIVLDKFHIVNLVNRAFNQTRISIMNSIKDDSLKRKFKLFWKLLLKYYPNLC